MLRIAHRYILILILIPEVIAAQANFTALGTPYTQDFNTLPNTVDGSSAAWVQNSTLPGWYIDEGLGGTCTGTSCDDLPMIEATYTTMNNGGNAYLYASGTDRSIGSRAAGSTGTNYFGVRIANATGSAITSIYIDYYGEQWTIAENQTNVNVFALEYQVGPTVTSLTAGAWTATALNFTQIYTSAQSAGMGGSACAGTSAQCLALDGNLTANRVHIQGCVTVAIPAGQEIMLRWADVNDPANDHHLQVDDVSIWPFDVACAIILPVEMTLFTAERVDQTALLHWETASEHNNDYFLIQRMNILGDYVTIGRVEGNGTTSLPSTYSFTDESPQSGINYYRLKQVDYNGQFEYSDIRSVEFEEIPEFSPQISFDNSQFQYGIEGAEGATEITVFSSDGKLISTTTTFEAQGNLPLPVSSGLYFVTFLHAKGSETLKIVILLEL